ncbi:MAG: hypothetical protein IPF99_27950 [Deltaproteobacteria bacterium]|nr:hypothetical protein [Deltaproteobacteria bacterium]
MDGVVQAHDYAQLSINTNRCKLVIVDGQHRAMSLLALYRNIKKWPENTRNVEPYYRIWTPDRIAKFDLDRAKMPIMFCVFPQLDGQQPGMRAPRSFSAAPIGSFGTEQERPSGHPIAKHPAR